MGGLTDAICFLSLRHEMSPILVKLCDTVLRTIDLASTAPGRR